MSLATGIQKEIQTLFPAGFALVMATGITSIASHLLHFEKIALLLFWINIIQYFILLILFAARVLFFFPNVVADLSSHAKGAGFLTVVAGSCILGTQCALLQNSYLSAQLLWAFSLIAWLLLFYSFLVLVIVKVQKPSLEKGLDGTWLLVVVSTQSLSILGSTLSGHLFIPEHAMLIVCLLLFLLGSILYLFLMPVVFLRLLFVPVLPEEVTPSYWINMGGAAITTLSGCILIQTFSTQPAFADFYTSIKAGTLLFWAAETFWIPIIVLLDVWRYGFKKSPIKYHPSYWSLVFPLGMYTACTWRLAAVTSFSFLQAVAQVFIYVAWVAWLITFAGMCRRLLNFFKTPYTTNLVKQ